MTVFSLQAVHLFDQLSISSTDKMQKKERNLSYVGFERLLSSWDFVLYDGRCYYELIASRGNEQLPLEPGTALHKYIKISIQLSTVPTGSAKRLLMTFSAPHSMLSRAYPHTQYTNQTCP